MGIAFLLLPVTLIVLTFPTWAERRSMAHSVARESALAVARSPDWVAGKAQAERMTEQIVRNYGLAQEEVRLAWDPDRGATEVQRGERVTAVVTVAMPALFVPAVGDIGSWETTIRHTETVDRYRSL
jgi:cytochrome c-type biogenesis protein CcmH/NrfG